jgi:hypothetical protein
MTNFFHKLKINYYKICSYYYWEFWSAKIFYLPIIFYYIYFCIRYRIHPLGISYANPCFTFGGLSFDSKYQMLNKFSKHKEFISKTIFISKTEKNLEEILLKMKLAGLNFPVIAKPDQGQRGSGVKLIRKVFDLEMYIQNYNSDFLLQEYINYPLEYGVFYIRNASKEGKIVSITRKLLPKVFGDGKSTLADLILKDRRARYLAKVYFKKNKERLGFILSKGDSIQLTHTGNHCQGAIFEDGAMDINKETKRKILEICDSTEGFYFGRFDIKFLDKDSLQNGQNFKILEINGAEAEMTHIYDRKNSIFYAYKTLFYQWDTLFAIAKKNKSLGYEGQPIEKMILEYVRYYFLENTNSESD